MTCDQPIRRQSFRSVPLPKQTAGDRKFERAAFFFPRPRASPANCRVGRSGSAERVDGRTGARGGEGGRGEEEEVEVVRRGAARGETRRNIDTVKFNGLIYDGHKSSVTSRTPPPLPLPNGSPVGVNPTREPGQYPTQPGLPPFTAAPFAFSISR